MTTPLQVLYKKHEEEIKALQDACLHEEVTWMAEMRRFGAFTNRDVCICKSCGKMTAERPGTLAREMIEHNKNIEVKYLSHQEVDTLVKTPPPTRKTS